MTNTETNMNSPRKVETEEEFIQAATELAALTGIEASYGRWANDCTGAARYYPNDFVVCLGPKGLRAALGNKPDSRKVAELVDAVVAEVAEVEGETQELIRSEIDGYASESGVRARIEIKMLDQALSAIVRAYSGPRGRNTNQGEIRALEILAQHFAA